MTIWDNLGLLHTHNWRRGESNDRKSYDIHLTSKVIPLIDIMIFIHLGLDAEN